jgi:hypothetical protein
MYNNGPKLYKETPPEEIAFEKNVKDALLQIPIDPTNQLASFDREVIFKNILAKYNQLDQTANQQIIDTIKTSDFAKLRERYFDVRTPDYELEATAPKESPIDESLSKTG